MDIRGGGEGGGGLAAGRSVLAVELRSRPRLMHFLGNRRHVRISPFSEL